MAADCLHPGGQDFTTQLIQYTAVPKGSAVLDAGCGAGATVQWLGQQGFAAYGIDQQPGQVSEQICQGDIRQLPYRWRFIAVWQCCFYLRCAAAMLGNVIAYCRQMAGCCWLMCILMKNRLCQSLMINGL
ncbi:MAG: class I SAM-dependent methyltransferase [Peptococcaceae bacterium]